LKAAPTYLQCRPTLNIEDYRLNIEKKAGPFLTPSLVLDN